MRGKNYTRTIFFELTHTCRKHTKNTEKIDKDKAITQPTEHEKRDVGRLILLFADDNLSDSMTMGEICERAFKILPEASIRSILKKIERKKTQERSKNINKNAF